MMIINRKQKGIGLLELMLSLAIIAILLIMATRYYLVTSRSQKVDEGLSLIQSVVAGANDWRGDSTTFTHEGNDIKMADLIQQGSIAKSYQDSDSTTTAHTPWGGSDTLKIEPASDKTKAVITMSSLPSDACYALANKFGGVKAPALKNTSCDSGTLSYTFPNDDSTQ